MSTKDQAPAICAECGGEISPDDVFEKEGVTVHNSCADSYWWELEEEEEQ